MSSFVKGKKKKKKTLIIWAILNIVFGVGLLGIHHWYIGSLKKAAINFIVTFIYAAFVVVWYFVTFPELNLTDNFPIPFILIYIGPTIFELIMVGLFPNSRYYEDVEWL